MRLIPRFAGAGLHTGVGGPVLYAEFGPPRRRGDPRRDDGTYAVRHSADPSLRRNEPDPGRTGYFNQYNQGKSSIFLNLRKREAVHLAYDLVEYCDVVTDNVSAGVIDKLGLGYHKLRTIKAASWRPTRPTGPAATTTSGSPSPSPPRRSGTRCATRSDSRGSPPMRGSSEPSCASRMRPPSTRSSPRGRARVTGGTRPRLCNRWAWPRSRP